MIAQIDEVYKKYGFLPLYRRIVSYFLFEGRPLTTRGRWINPFVILFLKFLGWTGFGKKVEAPIFIVGTGRSGTTILGKLLSMHHNVGFLNEPKALWYVVNPADDIIGSYADEPAVLLLDADDVAPGMCKTVHNIYSAYLRFVCAGRVVDKYPEMVFRPKFIKSIFPDAKFIFIARDGKDTCLSIDRWSKKHGESTEGSVADWWGDRGKKWSILVSQVVAVDEELKEFTELIKDYDNHVDRASVEWAVSMKAGLQLKETFPDSAMLLRYEDLVAQPENTLNQLLDFCSLDYDANLFDYAGNVLKRSSTDAGHIEIKKHVLPLFERMMQSLGYS